MKNHLTLSCRLGFACPSNNLFTTLRRPFWLAAMRAVQPFCVNWSSLSCQNQLLVHNTVPSISNTQNTLDLHHPSGPHRLLLQVTYPQLVDVHCDIRDNFMYVGMAWVRPCLIALEGGVHKIDPYMMVCMLLYKGWFYVCGCGLGTSL